MNEIFYKNLRKSHILFQVSNSLISKMSHITFIIIIRQLYLIPSKIEITLKNKFIKFLLFFFQKHKKIKL